MVSSTNSIVWAPAFLPLISLTLNRFTDNAPNIPGSLKFSWIIYIDDSICITST